MKTRLILAVLAFLTAAAAAPIFPETLAAERASIPANAAAPSRSQGQTCIVCAYVTPVSKCISCINKLRDGWWVCRTEGCNRCVGTYACKVFNERPAPLQFSSNMIQDGAIRQVASLDVCMAIALAQFRGEMLKAEEDGQPAPASGQVTLAVSPTAPPQGPDIEYFLSPNSPGAEEYLKVFDAGIDPANRAVVEYQITMEMAGDVVSIKTQNVNTPAAGKPSAVTVNMKLIGGSWSQQSIQTAY